MFFSMKIFLCMSLICGLAPLISRGSVSQIKAMKDLYLLDLNVTHKKSLSKLLQHDSFQQPDNELLETLKRIYWSVAWNSYKPLNMVYQPFIKTSWMLMKRLLLMSSIQNWRNSQQQDQALPPPHMQSLQQSEPTHSQLTQVHSHENEMTKYILNSMQPSSNLDPGQNSDMKFLQLVSIGSLQQNSSSGPHAPNN
ncbi:hypothetical protein HanRHA438_Chr03g0105201 [Helianthus annuus]|nr:hypothetical protein HanRHA438_Chr03g0105201 [Helianthus annuus]